MGKVSVNEIAAKLIERKDLSKKQATAFVNDMFDIIQSGLEKDKAVKVKGFGTFKIISVDDRESINVNTGERVLIEGHSKITFTPDSVIKELVNKPFSQFETVVMKASVNEIASKLIERKGLSKKQAAAFVNDMFDIIQRGLEEEDTVKVKGLGIFKIISMDDREEIDVNTGERVLIDGSRKITFTPDPVMKELVNKPFSQFETVILKDGVDFDDMEKMPMAMQRVEEEKTVASAVAKVESAPAVDLNVEPKPVIEEPKPVIEEPKPVIDEPKPVIEEPKPVIEEPKPVIDEPKPVIEEPKPVIEEFSDIPEDSEESPVEETYEEKSSGAWKKWIFLVLFCIVSFAAGYFASNIKSLIPEAQEPKELAKQEETPKPQPKKAVDSVKQDTMPNKEMTAKAEAAVSVPQSEVKAVTKSEVKPAAKPDVKPVAKPEVKPSAKPEPKPEVKPSVESESGTVDSKVYEAMDPRIRYGAYRIIGTDHVEKVKETDNLAKICKRTLGPGMECYIEAYNGIKGDASLKPGQYIKIPKLIIKKKKPKNTNLNT
jgi:nucleoid DNA-binding protein